MKKIKFGLLPRIAVAIILGIAIGGFVPAEIVRGVNTFTSVFDQFIKFMVPLIIVGLVAPAIAETGHGAGKMLLCTVSIAYASTLFAGFLGYFVSVAAFPSLVSADAAKAVEEAAKTFAPYVTIKIPPMLDVMSALVVSFIMGLGMIFAESDILKRGFVEFRTIITKAISVALVPLLPFYIFGIFLDMTAAGKTKTVLAAFAAIIAVFTLLTFVVILVQFCIAGAIARKNPLKAIYTMLPAYLTALGTSSSAATIPVTRAQTIKNGVSPETADFVVPLCATVHLAGSTVKLVSCAVALLLMAGTTAQINVATFAGFIAMIGIVMVAAPGVPGGAVMAALGILESMLGFDQAQLALMITLYVATDSIGTACNITGDGAIAMIMDRISP
ncbi:MAG: cation:dicarboxylase symporter family transporter, partial [Kiritimatiellae bacterium]|nr:cation:dicarboxylase symporter family transporter [Kiritimatiellia bacterium]